LAILNVKYKRVIYVNNIEENKTKIWHAPQNTKCDPNVLRQLL